MWNLGFDGVLRGSLVLAAQEVWLFEIVVFEFIYNNNNDLFHSIPTV